MPTAFSGTRFLFPSRDPIPTSILSSRDWIYYLQFLDHSSAIPVPPLPPSRLPSVFDAPIVEPWVSRIYWPFRARLRHPSLLHDESFLRASRFSFSDPPFFTLFMFRCSAISRLYLLTASFTITSPWHSYRFFQSSCPNVGSMTSACIE